MGLPIEVVQTDGTKLVVVQRTDLDLANGDSKARRLAYADNQASAIGLDWNAEQIAADLEAGVDLDSMFRKDELDEILKDLAPEPDDPPEPQIDRADELREKWQTERGQVWEIGEHRLMCGDCARDSVLDDIADLCLTDPPYGVKRDKGFGGFVGFVGFGGFGPPIARKKYSDDWDATRPGRDVFDLILKSAKSLVIFGGNFFADMLPPSTHWLVWDKKNTMPTFGDCELAWTNSTRHSVKKYEFEYNGLIGKEQDRFHPTQKPSGLFGAIITDYSEDGETVYDPFLGSGTTMVAAEQLGRRCFGMEISPAYVAVALQRMADMGLDPVLANG